MKNTFFGPCACGAAIMPLCGFGLPPNDGACWTCDSRIRLGELLASDDAAPRPARDFYWQNVTVHEIIDEVLKEERKEMR